MPLDDFQEKFAGTWSITEMDAELGTIEYRFDLPNISPEDCVDVPTIVSPTSPMTPPSKFGVHWQSADDASRRTL
jgi:hypothetical protein